MKRAKFDLLVSPSRLRLVQFLIRVLFIYLLFMTFEIPLVLKTVSGGLFTDTLHSRPLFLESEYDFTTNHPDHRVRRRALKRRMREFKKLSSGLLFNETSFDSNDSKDKFSFLHKIERLAFVVGKKLLDNLL